MNTKFSELVQQLRIANRTPGEPPRPIQWVAKQFRISRAFLYLLTGGRKRPSKWTMARIAKTAKVSKRAVAAMFPVPK